MRDCHSSNDKDVIAIDGKALPHSYDKSGRRGAGFRNLALALNTCYIEEVLASCSELGFRTDKMKNLTQI